MTLKKLEKRAAVKKKIEVRAVQTETSRTL